MFWNQLATKDWLNMNWRVSESGSIKIHRISTSEKRTREESICNAWYISIDFYIHDKIELCLNNEILLRYVNAWQNAAVYYYRYCLLMWSPLHFQVPQSELDPALVKSILSEYKIHNADIILREDASSDDLIDVVEGNRVYIPCIYILNKIDQVIWWYVDYICTVLLPPLFDSDLYRGVGHYLQNPALHTYFCSP